MKKTHGRESAHKASDPGEHVGARRVTILIREDQYEHVQKMGWSLSPLVRDLLDDRLSSNKVILSLSDDGKQLYDALTASIGTNDLDLEPFFLNALDAFLGSRLKDLQALREKLQSRKK